MIIDSHEHLLLPVERQLAKMDEAGIERAVLFGTTPHPELAKDLMALETEMAALQKILAGDNPQAYCERLREKNAEVSRMVARYPERFWGFGNVPLGLELTQTKAWLEEQITALGLCGVGEIAPGNETQMRQIGTILQAMQRTRIYPLWVHTFAPVSRDSLAILMELCQRYENIPVIFGHLGGTHWLEVIKFAKGQPNVYLDLSAAFSTLAVKMALTELPQRCLYSSDAPYGEPLLSRQLVEYMSPSPAIAAAVLGDNTQRVLNLIG